VLPEAPQGLEHNGAGERQEWECDHETLDFPPYLVDGVLVRAFLVPQALHGRPGLEFHAFTLTGPQLAISTAFKTFGSPGTIAALEWNLSVAELIMTTLTGSSTKSRPATSGV
jgi:hypothetical protein